MKKQMISIGVFLLMTSSVNVSYASSKMRDHNMASMPTAAESTVAKEEEVTIKLNGLKIESKEGKKLVQIKLTSIKDNKPVTTLGYAQERSKFLG